MLARGVLKSCRVVSRLSQLNLIKQQSRPFMYLTQTGVNKSIIKELKAEKLIEFEGEHAKLTEEELMALLTIASWGTKMRLTYMLPLYYISGSTVLWAGGVFLKGLGAT